MIAKKKVHKLSGDYESDFYLIGIASHENDYRISWAINNGLKWKLVKVNDFKVNHPKLKAMVNYSMYKYTDVDELFNYYLIANKSEKGFLLSEFKNIDYIIKVSADIDPDALNAITQKIKKIDIVITAFIIEDLNLRMQKMFVF